MRHCLVELRAEIDRGMADIAGGRLTDFDAERIIALGRKRLAQHSGSASTKLGSSPAAPNRDQ